MKYLKLIFREIRTSKARFFAVAAIFALGVGFFAGLGSTMPIMKKSMDRYADSCNLYDIKLISEYGFEAGDAENAVLSKSADAIIAGKAVRVMSLTEGINNVRLLEGRMPTAAGECLLGRNKMNGTLAALGETLTLSKDNTAQTLDTFKTDSFTVVGIIETPVFPSVQRGTSTVGQGALHHYIYVNEDEFNTDYYTEAYIALPQARDKLLFSDEYFSVIDSYSPDGIADRQLARVAQKAQNELDEKVSEYNSKKADAELEFEKAEAVLRDSAAKLEQAKAQIDSAKAQIDDARKNAAQLPAGMAEAVNAQIDAEQAQLDKSAAEYSASLAQYNSSLHEFKSKKAETEAKLSTASKELEDAQADIDALQPPEIYVMTLKDNYGVNAFSQDAERVNNIARVFPIIFFIVAALVCLTTMTRMIDEQRTKIGTLSALGYGKGAIAAHYLAYACIATAFGGIVGMAVGIAVIPLVIFNTYQILYSIPQIAYTADVAKSLGAFGVAIILTAVVTLWAALDSLRTRAAQLMRPPAPKNGKKVILEHIHFLWKHMSFTSKVTARNILRYKKRFFMTVIGIAGCCALLLTGFGLKDSISGMLPEQYGRIQDYDMTVYLAKDTAEARNVITENSDERLFAYNVGSDAKSESSNLECYIFVPEKPEELGSYISLHERKSGVPVDFPADGYAVIAEKLSYRLGLDIGDSISVKRGEGDYVTLKISGITENYIYNYIYMSPNTYRDVFEKEPEYNEALVKTADAKTAGDTIIANEDIASVMLSQDMITGFSDVFKSLNGVVWLLIVSACLLNFVVLYNLTNINIGERIREIATIKVLGFYPHETDAYIYRENIVLTLVGTAVGLLLGRVLHGFVISTAEIDMIMFTRSISAVSYILSALLTVLFSTLVNFFMHFKLKKISMTESLKSIE